jgi:hypothetical protein
MEVNGLVELSAPRDSAQADNNFGRYAALQTSKADGPAEVDPPPGHPLPPTVDGDNYHASNC